MRMDKVRDFFQRHADGMVSGPLDWLEEIYVYPLAVFRGNHIFVEKTPDETRQALLERREDYLSVGLGPGTQAEVKVLSQAMLIDNRMSVTVMTLFSNPETGKTAKTLSKFFCRLTDVGTIKIESLEIVERDVPSFTGSQTILH
jgi:hypothetical protein